MTTDVNRTDGQMDELKSCEGSTPTKSHELQVTDLPQPGKRGNECHSMKACMIYLLTYLLTHLHTYFINKYFIIIKTT